MCLFQHLEVHEQIQLMVSTLSFLKKLIKYHLFLAIRNFPPQGKVKTEFLLYC